MRCDRENAFKNIVQVRMGAVYSVMKRIAVSFSRLHSRLHAGLAIDTKHLTNVPSATA